MEKKGVLTAGKKVKGYRIKNFIKSYDDSQVECYLATDNENMEYVLKLFRGPLSGKSVEYNAHGLFQGNLCPYAQVVASGTCTVNNEKCHYMVRKIFKGNTLASIIKNKKKYTWKEAKYVIFQVLTALKYLHNNKISIVHNNINPKTVLIDNSYRWDKVCLLGSSNFSTLNDNAPRPLLERIDRFFMAPESLTGKIDTRSDIYAVGALMFTLLFGPEYRNIALSPTTSLDDGDTCYSIRLLTEPLQFNFIELPQPEKECLKKMMEVDPEKRYQSVEEALDGLIDSKHEEEWEYEEDVAEEVEAIKPKKQRTREKAGHKNRQRAKSGVKSRSGDKKGFADVAGMEDLKEMFRKRVLFVIENPKTAKEYRLSMPNGILLFGPPGCGKTFVAEKFAEEANMNFITVKASDLGSSYMHATQNNIAKLFAKAKKDAPTVLFFDELDALVPNRMDMHSENMAGEVNEFLTHMNNCADSGVFVIGTTNCPEKIDPAVLRTGRIDRIIYVPLPDTPARKEIFRLELEGRKHDKEIDYDLLAQKTEGYVASDISFIVKECAFESAFKSVPISQQLILDTIKATRRSLSQEQVAMYEDKRKKFENKTSTQGRVKIGFKI